MRRRGLILLALQLLLVLSVAAKFAYDRLTRPRIWVRTAPYDPDTPLRGRYVSLQLQVDACAATTQTGNERANRGYGPGFERLQLQDSHGQLIAVPLRPDEDGENVRWDGTADCHNAVVSPPVALFVPEHAALPLPPKDGQQLWVEVTLPKHGAPRPIRLATSDVSNFHVLDIR